MKLTELLKSVETEQPKAYVVWSEMRSGHLPQLQ